INHAKKLGAKLIVLEVLDINEPAYELYRSLDFVHYDSLTRQKLDFGKLSDIPSIALPEGYELREFTRDKKTNQARYELDMRVTPEDVQVFHPIDRKRYFKPLIIRMVRPIAILLLKLKRFDWLIYQRENLVGDVSVYPSRKEGSPHRINLMLDPARSDILSEPMISHCLVTLRNNSTVEENTIVEFRTSATKQLETTRKYDFVDVETMHLLGLKIEE
ncbi:unnamed protein product, partial [marine sediment metagenome]